MDEQAPKRIMVVEDDPEVARTIDHVLREFDFETVCCRNAHELFRRVKTGTPDLCIVDLGLPDMDGIEVMQKLRSMCSCAIIILTGRTHVSDKVMGLEMGADDYVLKPFEPRELVARIRSVLRRHTPGGPAAPEPPKIAEFSGWRFDPRINTLTAPDGAETLLSTAESELLAIFLANPNRIVHRDKLIGNRNLSSADRSVDVRMSRLRRKLESNADHPKLILTVYGAGYLLKSAVTWT